MSNVTTSPAANVTATATVTPDLAPSAKLFTSVSALLNAQITVGRKFESMIEQVLADKAERSYNREQCRAVLQTAFRNAYEKLGKADKLEGDALKERIEAGMKRSGTDISKALTIAFPKDEAAAIELEKAQAEGFGINAQLDISRGNATVESIKQERANKAAGAKTETARPNAGTAPTTPATPGKVQPPAPETAAQAKLTAPERFELQIIALKKFGASLDLTPEQMLDLITDSFATEEASEGNEAKAGA